MIAQAGKASRPYVAIAPIGDDEVAAELLGQSAINSLTSTLEAMAAAVSLHRDAAPTSADHVLRLRGTLAQVVLEFLECWPS